jgi:hypothetical protein
MPRLGEMTRYCSKGHDKDVVGRETRNICRICFLDNYIEYLRNTSNLVGDYYEVEMFEFPELATLPTPLPMTAHRIWASGWPDDEFPILLQHEIYNEDRARKYEEFKERQRRGKSKGWGHGID